MPIPRKKKKIIVLIQSQSRLTNVFDQNIDSIEFVRTSDLDDPNIEVEEIDEARLSTDDVDALNAACHIPS